MSSLWASWSEMLQPFHNTLDHNTNAVGKDLSVVPEVSRCFLREDQLLNILAGCGALCYKLALRKYRGSLELPSYVRMWKFFRMVVSFGHIYTKKKKKAFCLGQICTFKVSYPISSHLLTEVCIVHWLQSLWNGFFQMKLAWSVWSQKTPHVLQSLMEAQPFLLNIYI